MHLDKRQFLPLDGSSIVSFLLQFIGSNLIASEWTADQKSAQ